MPACLCGVLYEILCLYGECVLGEEPANGISKNNERNSEYECIKSNTLSF